MNLADITPLVLTYNEAPNIARSLELLRWAREVVVVDSLSSDATVDLARQFPNVRIVERAFDTLATQWNFGLQATGITSEWVLALDADYLVTDAWLAEIQALVAAPEASAYRAPFVYVALGRPLRGSCYGPVAVLFRRTACEFHQDGHAHRLRVLRGEYATLHSPLLHDDRKPLSRWLTNQLSYMELEAQKLGSLSRADLSWADRLRLTIFGGPPVMLVYCLFVQRGLLDGWAGWYYAFQRTVTELLLSLKLIEQRLLRRGSPPRPTDNDSST